jgi:hypothetical protein
LAAGLAFTTGLATGLLVALLAVLATLATGLGAAFGAAFFTTGFPFGAALAVTVLTGLAGLAGVGLLSFLAGAADLALALDAVLVFFTADFELVLRGFFTSCLLAVAAYAPFQAPAIGK